MCYQNDIFNSHGRLLHSSSSRVKKAIQTLSTSQRILKCCSGEMWSLDYASFVGEIKSKLHFRNHRRLLRKSTMLSALMNLLKLLSNHQLAWTLFYMDSWQSRQSRRQSALGTKMNLRRRNSWRNWCKRKPARSSFKKLQES